MLVLTRKPGESVELSIAGRTIGRVAVARSRNGQTQLAFDLDDDVSIVRSELPPLAGDEIERQVAAA